MMCHTLDHVTEGLPDKKSFHSFFTSAASKESEFSSPRMLSSQKPRSSFFIHSFQGKVMPIFGLSTISRGSRSPSESVSSFLGVCGYLYLSGTDNTYSTRV